MWVYTLRTWIRLIFGLFGFATIVVFIAGLMSFAIVLMFVIVKEVIRDGILEPGGWRKKEN